MHNDQETLQMAREIMAHSLNSVQVILNRFWDAYGQPTPKVMEKLQARITDATETVIEEFFPEWLVSDEE